MRPRVQLIDNFWITGRLSWAGRTTSRHSNFGSRCASEDRWQTALRHMLGLQREIPSILSTLRPCRSEEMRFCRTFKTLFVPAAGRQWALLAQCVIPARPPDWSIGWTLADVPFVRASLARVGFVGCSGFADQRGMPKLTAHLKRHSLGPTLGP